MVRMKIILLVFNKSKQKNWNRTKWKIANFKFIYELYWYAETFESIFQVTVKFENNRIWDLFQGVAFGKKWFI